MRTTHPFTNTCGHGTLSSFGWQWILDVHTPFWKCVTSFLKLDVVDKVQLTWIQKVLYGMNSGEDQVVYFDKPGQISCGSSSHWCGMYQGTLHHSPPWRIESLIRVTSM